MKTRGSGDIAPLFFTFVLDGDEWSASFPRPSTPIGRANLTGGWVGLRTDLDNVEIRKIIPLPGFKLQTLGCPVRVSH
jgi:hypothetical protein